eukprot:scaffold177697_cov14-Prasinocladus_malaysianus.AAC.1
MGEMYSLGFVGLGKSHSRTLLLALDDGHTRGVPPRLAPTPPLLVLAAALSALPDAEGAASASV